MKFCHSVPGHIGQVSSDFGDSAPDRLLKKGQKGSKLVISHI